MKWLCSLVLSVWIVLLTTGNLLHAATFFVAPDGNDLKPGTNQQPMATLGTARDAARKAGGGEHRIVVLPGDYYLATTLELDMRDNGLTIEAESTGRVTLYGGRLVTGWQRDGDHFWSAALPGVKERTWDFRALIVNGRLAERARFPGTGTFENRGTWNLPVLPMVAGFWERKPTWEELTTMPYDPKDIPDTLDIDNAEVLLYHTWDESLVGVTRNDTQRHSLILSPEPTWPPGARNMKKYAILNTREGMNRPGQWYLDRTAGRLVYWPLPDEDMAKAKIIAPTTEQIIRISGKNQQKAEMITIRGLTLQASTVPLKPAGFGGGAFDGALTISKARMCTIEGLEIYNVGGGGISGDDLAQCRIANCRIHHVGSCGVRINNGVDISFSQNQTHNVGVYYLSSAAVKFSGMKIHLQANEISDVPYSGMICIGKEYLVEQNLIYRVMRELHDGAAFYGSLHNSTIRDNFVRDVVQVGEGSDVSAYYLDEGSSDCVIERNVAQGVRMPVHNHIARDITVRDNVFIADKDMIVSFQRSTGCTFTRNTLFIPGKLNVLQPNAIKDWQDNVVFKGGSGRDGTSQAFTIDGAVPNVPAPNRKTLSAVAERVSHAPVLDGKIDLGGWPGKLQRLDREPSRQGAVGPPVLVKFLYDDQFLYVLSTMPMFAPAKIDMGSAWGKSDGVEICIAGLTIDGKKPATFVVRGFAGGAVQSSTVAGAPEKATVRLGKEVRFVAGMIKDSRDNTIRGWRGGWSIPFADLGLEPKPGLKIAFNMCAFYSELGTWHCWEGTLTDNWQLAQAGTIQLGETQ